MVNYLSFTRALHMRPEVTVSYLMKCGNARTVRCALRNGKVNPYTVTVWDLEKNEYRNIPKAKIIWFK